MSLMYAKGRGSGTDGIFVVLLHVSLCLVDGVLDFGDERETGLDDFNDFHRDVAFREFVEEEPAFVPDTVEGFLYD